MPHRRAAARSLPYLTCLAALIFTPALARPQAATLVQSTTHYAGTGSAGYNGDGGIGTTAAPTSILLNGPSYLAFDSLGNQYISDTLNNCIRKIDTSNQMSTVVGLHVPNLPDTCSTVSNPNPYSSQGLYRPTGIAVDSANNLYISDSGHNCVRKLAANATGVASLTTVAGTCDVATTASATPNPNGLAVDASNNLYISIQDTEVNPAASVYQVLKKSSSGLCVLAGATYTNGPASCPISSQVQLNIPSGLAINALGNLFIADTGNNCVREVINMNLIKTVAGQCANDSSGSSQTALNQPYGLAFSPTQSLLITESNPGNLSNAPNNVYNFVLGSTALTLVAGLPNGTSGTYSATQDGQSALNVPLNNPRGIAVDTSGNIFVADYSNNIGRKLSSNVLFPSTRVGDTSLYQITFVINQSVNLTASLNSDFSITSNNCSGPLSPASAGNAPATCQVGVAFKPTRPGPRSATLQLTDSISGTTVLQGVQGVAAGSYGDFTPGVVITANPSLSKPSAVTVDSLGNTYVLEKGSSAANADLIMIPAGGGPSQTIIPKGAGLATPSAIAIDAVGNYFIADAAQGTVSRFGADGSINTSYITGLDTPTAILVDSFDNLYIAEAGATHSVIESYASGIRRTISSSFVQPMGLIVDAHGDICVSDAAGHYVYGINPAGAQFTIAGNGTVTDSNTGQATGTALLSPTSLTIDAAGDIYVADPAANRVYTVYASTTANGTTIASILGTGTAGYTGDGGPANTAQVNNPSSIALDSSNNLYVVDLGNSALRAVSYPNPTITFPTTLVNQSSAVIPQSITNFGSINLNLTSAYTISNPQFVLDPSTTTCGNTILPGATCNLGLIFAPTTPGQITGTLTVASDASDSPEILNLVGNAQPIAPPAFTFPTESEVYGQPFPEAINLPATGPAPTGTITFTYNGKVLCTVSGSPLPTVCNAPNSGLSVAPSYPVTITYSGDSNYTGSTNAVTLAVTPAPLNLDVNRATRPYDTPNPALTGTLTGVVNGDNIQVSYATTATLTSAPGPYPITGTITAISPTLLSNYIVNNNAGTLTITADTITVQVLNQTRVYGAQNPTFTSTVTGPNGNTIQISYTSSATPSSPIGTYAITATVSGIDAQDFTPTILPGVLTVTPAPLAVVVANASKNAGDPNPSFSATITGALNGDTFTNSFSTSATTDSPAGAYPINDTPAGANISDYAVSVTPGVLTVNDNSGGGGTGPGGGGTGPGGGGGTGPGGGGTGPGSGGTGTGSTTVDTTTTVTTSQSPAPEGTSVTFTATVAAASGTPSGTVNFMDGGTPLGTGTLDATGNATFSTTTLAIGTHTIDANYIPAGGFNASSGSVAQIIAAPGSFTLSAAPPSQYLKGAGTVTYQVTVTSAAGFAGQVALSCSGLPADATCAFGSNPTLTAGASQTTPMTVTLTANDAKLRLPSDGLAPIVTAMALPFELSGLSVLFAGISRRKRLPGRIKLLLIVLATLSTITLAGCGCPPTVYQTYTVTITGSSPGATTQTTTVLLAAGN